MCRNNEARVPPFPLSLTGCSHCHQHQLVCCQDSVGQILGCFFYAKIYANPAAWLSESQDYGQHSVACSCPWMHRLLLQQVPEHQAASCFPCVHDDRWHRKLKGRFALVQPVSAKSSELSRVCHWGRLFSVCVYSRTRKEGCKIFFQWQEICETFHRI